LSFQQRCWLIESPCRSTRTPTARKEGDT